MPDLDTRIVYGARCTWWDSISAAGTRASGLPCCPHCGSSLFEVASEREWQAYVAKEEARRPGYSDFVEWLRGRCFPDFTAAEKAFAEQPPEITLGDCLSRVRLALVAIDLHELGDTFDSSTCHEAVAILSALCSDLVAAGAIDPLESDDAPAITYVVRVEFRDKDDRLIWVQLISSQMWWGQLNTEERLREDPRLYRCEGMKDAEPWTPVPLPAEGVVLVWREIPQ